jgi:hypothetical protein
MPNHRGNKRTCHLDEKRNSVTHELLPGRLILCAGRRQANIPIYLCALPAQRFASSLGFVRNLETVGHTPKPSGKHQLEALKIRASSSRVAERQDSSDPRNSKSEYRAAVPTAKQICELLGFDLCEQIFPSGTAAILVREPLKRQSAASNAFANISPPFRRSLTVRNLAE